MEQPNLSFAIDGASDSAPCRTDFAFSLRPSSSHDSRRQSVHCGGGGALHRRIVFSGVDDGVYVMLSPPARTGLHRIHFHGYFPVYNFTLDVTYNLMVTK